MKEIVRLCILVACVMTIIGIDCMCLLYVSCLLHVSVNWLHVSMCVFVIGCMYLLQMSIISYKCLCVYDYTGFLIAN